MLLNVFGHYDKNNGISYHLHKLFYFKADRKEMATCIEWTSISISKIAGRKKMIP